MNVRENPMIPSATLWAFVLVVVAAVPTSARDDHVTEGSIRFTFLDV